MGSLLKRFKSNPVLLRVVPFFLFALITFVQGQLEASWAFWFYLLKTITGAWVLWVIWDCVKEMKWALSWEAVVTGVLVFFIWIGLEGHYPLLMKRGDPWNPFATFGEGTTLAWFFIIVRVVGSTLVVPPVEELFYRSFLYRWIVKPEFDSVPLGTFSLKAFLMTSAFFGIVHFEWLPGLLCGLAYQGLVLRKKRLGDAMTAHAITNFLLSLWVVARGQWHFW